jgi:hypothetical protein
MTRVKSALRVVSAIEYNRVSQARVLKVTSSAFAKHTPKTRTLVYSGVGIVVQKRRQAREYAAGHPRSPREYRVAGRLGAYHWGCFGTSVLLQLLSYRKWHISEGSGGLTQARRTATQVSISICRFSFVAIVR